MNAERMDYRDAVIKIAGDFGIAIPRVKYDEAKEDKLSRDYLLLEKSAQFFEKNLYEDAGKEARNYLKKRGLNSNIAKKFRLGFALDSYEKLTDFLRAENFSETEILRSGIIGKNEKNRLYDKFRNRIIFPITDKKNRIIAFGGRSIGDDMPKYLNSAETEIFKKNQTLYNLANARSAIFSKGFAIVVEGYMDAIALAANGIENVIAGLGTALGIEHLKELFYTTDKIVICLDGDAAGIRAAKRVSEIALPLISARKNIAFAFLPGGLDPDDFIKKSGSKELEKILLAATPLSESLFEFALTELGIDKNKKISAEDKAKIEANLNAKISVIADFTTKRHFSSFFKNALFFRLSHSGEKNGGKKTGGGKNNFSSKIHLKPQSDVAENLGKQIIALMLKFPELTHFRNQRFDIHNLHLSSEKMTRLKDLIIEKTDISEFANEMAEIKNLLASLGNTDLESGLIKFRILLLKDLLLQVESQCMEITDHKIEEIVNYKSSLQFEILDLERQII